MSYWKWLFGGLVGAAIGSAIWIAVGYALNMEVGYIAWAVGLLAGLGVRKMAGDAEGAGPGMAAVLAAVTFIFIAKYAVVSLSVDKVMQQFANDITDAPTEDEQIAWLANDVVEELEEQKQEIKWPANAGEDDITDAADFPPEIWTKAKEQWTALSAEEKQQRVVKHQEEMAAVMQMISDQAKQHAWESSFGPYDLLWFGLAAFTAFKVGRGGDENQPPAQPATEETPPTA